MLNWTRESVLPPLLSESEPAPLTGSALLFEKELWSILIKLSPGTLYRSIQRMLEQGLIQETPERPAPELDDERRRYYRITSFGRAVAKAEARRLAQLVKLARESGFVPGRA